MMHAIFKGLIAALAAWLLSLGLVSPAHAGAYEAELPPQLATAADLCALVPCAQVLPGATHFSARMGQPPYVEGYRTGPGGTRELLGYVMLSTDITDTPAYSGKPVVTLIGMDTQGRYAGVKVLKHSEPILLLGIPESALLAGFQPAVRRQVGRRQDRSGAVATRRRRGRRRCDFGRHGNGDRAEPGADHGGCGGGAAGRHTGANPTRAGALR
ncbi:exported hypothetical protein [Cupriavidus taiwanensis]|nr:exported hypothetical protein [Cupriavidus taiwanensis]